MIVRMAKKITDFLEKKGVLIESNAIHQHGIEVLLSEGISFSVIVLISAIFHHFWFGVLYLFFFAVLREYSGGYHASSYFKCIVFMIAIYIISLMFYSFVENNWVYLMMALLSSLYLYPRVPVQHKNRRLSKKEKLKYRKIARNIIIFDIGIVMSSFVLLGYAVPVICIVLAVTAVLMIVHRCTKNYVR